MIIDTSAIIAIILKESEAQRLLTCIAENANNPLIIAAPTYFETFLVLTGRYNDQGIVLLHTFRIETNLVIHNFDEDLMSFACAGYTRYSRGKYGLNFGDCFSYALAKQRSEPLLCKGDDFKHTDIELAAY
jgi:ribonuclease VapC